MSRWSAEWPTCGAGRWSPTPTALRPSAKVPEPGLVGGVEPIAYCGIAVLTGYVTANQRVIACSNQDVVYGPGSTAKSNIYENRPEETKYI